MRILKQLPTSVAVALILLLVGALAYGGWRISQRSILGSSGPGGTAGGGNERQARGDRDFETELMESFANELNEADDVERDERDAAYEILREADAIWSRVKQQNSDAIKRANRRPRIVPPQVGTWTDESDPFLSDPIQ